MERKHRQPGPTFEETNVSTETSEFGPRRCRHVRDGDPPFRQLWEWSAHRGDIIASERYHLVLCVSCTRMLADFAELRADFPKI